MSYECIGCNKETSEGKCYELHNGPVCFKCLTDHFIHEARQFGILQKDQEFIRQAAIARANIPVGALSEAMAKIIVREAVQLLAEIKKQEEKR